MEKNQEMPPSDPNQGHGYKYPQQPPPNYHGSQQGGQQPPQYYGPPPPLQYQHQQYSNVIVTQPMHAPMTMGVPPPDHMTAAIFVTFCCFWPTGIIAIMKANEAKNAYIRGDLAAANSSAQSAKTMINVTVIVGICVLVVVGAILGLYIGLVDSVYDNAYDD